MVNLKFGLLFKKLTKTPCVKFVVFCTTSGVKKEVMNATDDDDHEALPTVEKKLEKRSLLMRTTETVELCGERGATVPVQRIDAIRRCLARIRKCAPSQRESCTPNTFAAPMKTW